MRRQTATPFSEAPSFETPQPSKSVSTLRRKDLRQNLRFSLVEGSFFSTMVGVGETYLPAFLLWMGLGNVAAGLITTVPLLAGAFLQLVAPSMVARQGSYRRWVTLCASLQGVIFIPLIAAALLGHLPVWVAFLSASLYWAGGLGASGAWNSWMGTLVPHQVQVGFFTRRTRLTQMSVFFGFCLGGLLLHWIPLHYPKSYAFVAIFTIALVCRFVSIAWVRRQSEPVKPNPENFQRLRLRDFVFRLHRSHEQGRLFSYLLSVTFAAHLAAPYFTSYMLGELKLSYSAYTCLIAVPFLAKILFLPYFGRMAAARGTRSVLIMGGTGLVVLPALWLVSQKFSYLLFLQLLSGFTWGAYELAALLLIWELVKPEERTCALTAYNFANAAAMTVGSVTGGLLFSYFGASGKAFVVLFALSTFARTLTVFWLRGIATTKVSGWPMGLRTIAVRPAIGAIALPVIGKRNKKQSHERNA
jgi:MFS family permease